MRRTRRLVVSGRAAVVGAAVAAALAGCSFTNPATIATPYPASDGTAGEIVNAASGESLKLLNFLLVATEPGAPGVLSGALVNNGTSPVTVRLTVLDDSDPAQLASIGGTSLDVPAGALVRLGSSDTPFQLASVPVPPGSEVLVDAATDGGSTRFALPVVAPVDEYASLTPTPEATPTPKSSASPSDSASPSPTDG